MLYIDYEIWRPIIKFPGYEVSSIGRVKAPDGSLKKTRLLGRKTREYKQVCTEIRSHTCIIARLMAEAFILNPNNLPEVDHIDRNPLNNNLNNIRWVTRDYNLRNRRRYHKGLRPIKLVDIGGNIIKRYNSIPEATKDLCVSNSIIYKRLKQGFNVKRDGKLSGGYFFYDD